MSVDFLDLSIRELSRNFGRRRALTRVSLDCRSGEIVGLLGPNGAGKSTLLAILSTLAAPSSGEVLYGGRTARANRRACAIAHRRPLARPASVFRAHGASRTSCSSAASTASPNPETVAADALRRARLDDRGGDLVSGFSRGMRQRLALERALLHNPRLLLLDEPFTGLDDASTMALIERLRELRAAGCIMLVATHDLDVGEAVLDRAVILHDGRLIASEPDVRGLRKRYQDRLQAGAAS